MTTWAIKDSNGRVLPGFLGSSRIEVGCKVVPARYDAFRLHVSSSYRELFDRTLQQVLECHGWQIVQIKRPSTDAPDAAVIKGEGAACARYPGTPVLAANLRQRDILLTLVKAQAPRSGQPQSAADEIPLPDLRPLQTGPSPSPQGPVEVWSRSLALRDFLSSTPRGAVDAA